MRLIPFDHVLLRTALSPDEVLRRLAERVERRRILWKRVADPEKPLRGAVEAGRIHVRRGREGPFDKQAGLVIADGVIGPDAGGARLELSLRLAWWYLAMIGLAAAAFLVIAAGAAARQRGDPLFVLVTLAPVAILYVATVASFSREAPRVRKLVELLAAAAPAVDAPGRPGPRRPNRLVRGD